MVHHALGDPVVPTDPLHVDLVVAVGPELLQGGLINLFSAAFLALFLRHAAYPPSA